MNFTSKDVMTLRERTGVGMKACADALKAALGEAGFDKDNPDHLLVVVGDLFDRGPSNREVLAFLMTIKNKILILVMDM